MEKIDLKHFSYQNLKSLSSKDKEVLASLIREEIIKDVLSNGGHLSSNLGVVELTIELLSSFDIEHDDILFDVSHQTYTYKLLTNRDLALIRLKDGISGFSNIEESKFDKVTGGHSGTALSIASGISTAKKLNNDNSSTIVVIGDASISNGVSFEALNTTNNSNYGKLIIVLNDNNMSISKPTGSFSEKLSKLRTSYFYQNGAYKFSKIFNRKGLRWLYIFLKSIKDAFKRMFLGNNVFETFDYVYIGPIDGHNFKKLKKAFIQAKRIDKSLILHVRTIKGKGYKQAQEDDVGYYHGVSSSKANKCTYLSSFSSQAILEKMNNDSKAVLICPAMILGSKLEKCFQKYPSRCFDTGITEEHCIDLACGFAIQHYHPIVVIYSCFMQRSYDQLLADLSLMKQNVLIVVERSGLTGQDGPSHQGIFDVSMELSMPNSIIYQPSSSLDLYNSILNYNFDTNCPYFIRVERQPSCDQVELVRQNTNKYILNKNSSNNLLILTGVKANELISLFNNSIDTLQLNQIKPIDSDLVNIISEYKNIFIYEYTSTSLKEYISYLLLENHYKGNVYFFCLNKKFIEHMSVDQQLETNSLLPKQVYKAIMDILNSKIDK